MKRHHENANVEEALKKSKTEEIHHDQFIESSASEEYNIKDWILPIEIKLYILEFYDFPLYRYLNICQHDVIDEGKSFLPNVPLSLFSKRQVWACARKVARKRMLKMMFGYFVRNVTNVESERVVYLLFTHVNFMASGIWGQDEYFTEIRFKDLKSIEYPNDHTLACQYFDFKQYLPNLEKIVGLNLENEVDLEDFLKHDNTKLRSLSFGSAKNTIIYDDCDKDLLFSAMPNLTRLEMSGSFLDQDCIDAITGNLQQLRHVIFSYGGITLEGVQSMLDKLEHLESMDLSNPEESILLDDVFTKLKQPIKLRKFIAPGNTVQDKFFENIVKASPNLRNLKELSISIYDYEDEDQYKSFFNTFSQLTHLSFEEQILDSNVLRHLTPMTNLQSFAATVKSVSEFKDLPSLKILIVTLLDKHTVLDFSTLNQVEQIQIDTMYGGSFISALKNETILPNLKRVKLCPMNEIMNDIILIENARPNLKIDLDFTMGGTFSLDLLIECKSIEKLKIPNSTIPKSIETNHTLKHLEILNGLLDGTTLKYLANNESLEEVRIYFHYHILMGEIVEICEFFEKSKASFITFVDPSIVGFVSGFDGALLW